MNKLLSKGLSFGIVLILIFIVFTGFLFNVSSENPCENKLENNQTSEIKLNKVDIIGKIGTFNVNDFEIEHKNGKPVIRLFATTWCPHCTWIKDSFSKITKEFVQKNQIVAYIWDIDTGDNVISTEIETEVPKTELEILYTFNPKGSIPTFIFGNKFWRIGNGYEREDNLEKEEAEFRDLIKKLINKEELTFEKNSPSEKKSINNFIPEYKNIEINTAKDLIKSIKDIVILDVRTQSEYESIHIANSISVPIDELEIKFFTLNLDIDGSIIIYDKDCTQSENACEFFIKWGFTNIYNLKGGIEAWINAGFEIVGEISDESNSNKGPLVNQNNKYTKSSYENKISFEDLKYRNINVEQAKELLNTQENVILVDVRKERDFDIGHISSSISIPFEEVEERINELNKKDIIIVICDNGINSKEICEILMKNRFNNIYNLIGGINAWLASGSEGMCCSSKISEDENLIKTDENKVFDINPESSVQSKDSNIPTKEFDFIPILIFLTFIIILIILILFKVSNNKKKYRQFNVLFVSGLFVFLTLFTSIVNGNIEYEIKQNLDNDQLQYDFSKIEDGSWIAMNQDNNMQLSFSQKGIEIIPKKTSSETWQFEFNLVQFGRERTMFPVKSAQPTGNMNRIEYIRENYTEWYINSENGLKQGFDIYSPPEGDRDSPLTIKMAINGDIIGYLVENGKSIVITTSSGLPVLQYTDLYVWDSSGNEISANLMSNGKTISILIDDENALYPITVDPWIFEQRVKLTANDGEAEDEFGGTVSIYDETAVIGSPNDDANGIKSGSAYVFVENNGVWNQQAKLTASDGSSIDRFGSSVAIYGDTIVVGAPFYGEMGAETGAAYVFIRSGNTWSQQAKLMADDADAGDSFGTTVSIYRNHIVVGSPYDDDTADDSGSVYLFISNGFSWSQSNKFTASDPEEGDSYGASVYIGGTRNLINPEGNPETLSPVTIVVGAPLSTDAGTKSGSVYVIEFFFSYMGYTSFWAETAKLTASDASANSWFGVSVSISVDTIVVGAGFEDHSGLNSGSAYVFTLIDDTWTQQAKLTANDAEASALFGWSVSIDGHIIVIGAEGDDNGIDDSGSAYVFTGGGSNWNQRQKLSASDADVEDYFGFSVSIDDHTVVIGANSDDDLGRDSGSAYVFQLLNDFDADGVEDSLDNCPTHSNPRSDWRDTNSNRHYNEQKDFDLDGVGDVCDNCPYFPNADQADDDDNGIGDACDSNTCGDNTIAGGCIGPSYCDGITDPEECVQTGGGIVAGFCTWEPICSCASGYANSNGDWSDGCEDLDTDRDLIGNSVDNCIINDNTDQADNDEFKFNLRNDGTRVSSSVGSLSTAGQNSDNTYYSPRSEDFDSDFEVGNLIDDNTWKYEDSYWKDDALSGVIIVKMPSVRIVSKIILDNLVLVDDFGTINYLVEYSTDTTDGSDGNWWMISADSSGHSAMGSYHGIDKREIIINWPNNFQYFRISLTRSSGDFLTLNEIEVYGIVGDGIGDVCDICPDRYDPNQEDIDNDGVGDACDCSDNQMGPNEDGADCGGICPDDCPDYCIPYIVNGDDDDKIDLVFVIDEDYEGYKNLFLHHISNLVNIELGATTPIDANMDKFNFYFMLNEGDSTTGCGGTLPTQFNNPECDMADAVVIIHNNNIQDCTSGFYQYTAEGHINTFIHESGHAVFKLIDEYCGNTYYKQNDDDGGPANVWSSRTNCRNDANSEGWNPDDCRRIMRDDPATPGIECSKNFWKIDHDPPEIMFDNQNGFGIACQRRINWIFDQYPDSSSRGGGNRGEVIEKSTRIDLNIRNGIITELNTRIEYGDARDHYLNEGDFVVSIFSSSGSLLEKFGIYDPRVQLAEQGSTFGGLADDVNFSLIFPFYDNMKTVEVANSTAGTIIILDLSEEIFEFCYGIKYKDMACKIYDLDNDSVLDSEDNCPLMFNPDQTDLDNDGIGDVCDENISFTNLTPPRITIIKPIPYFEIRTDETIEIIGTSTGLKPGSHITIFLADNMATCLVMEDGAWSVNIRSPNAEGNYLINVGWSNKINVPYPYDDLTTHYTIFDQNNSVPISVKKKDVTDGPIDLILLGMLLLIIILIIIIFASRVKKTKFESEDKSEMYKEKNGIKKVKQRQVKGKSKKTTNVKIKNRKMSKNVKND